MKRLIPKYQSGKGYTRKNDNPIAFDEEGNLVDQVTGETGSMLLPNVTVKPKRYDAYNSTYDGNAIRNFTDWLPGVGDVAQGFDAYDAAKRGNYLEAGMLGGMLLLPNVLEKPLKYVGRKAFPYIAPITMRFKDNISDKINTLFRNNKQQIDYFVPNTKPNENLYPDLINVWGDTERIRDEVTNYALDPNRKLLKQRMIKEAVESGWLDPKYLGSDFNALNPKINFPEIKLADLGEGIQGSYKASENVVKIKPKVKDPTDTNYHEHLHWKQIGSLPTWEFDKEVKSALDKWFDDWRLGPNYEKVKKDAVEKYSGLQKLYADKIERILDINWPYIRKSDEFVVNGLTDGRKLKIKPFSEYPGDFEFENNVLKTAFGRTDLNLLPVLKQKPKYYKDIWDILSGNYLYGGLGAASLYNTYNNE